MRKILFILFTCMLVCKFASAVHIKGGYIQYKYMGPDTAAGYSRYSISLYIYRDCGLGQGPLPMPTSIGVYNAKSFSLVRSVAIINNQYTLAGVPIKEYIPPCIEIADAKKPCYLIYTYSTTVALKDDPDGYIIAASDATRVAGLINIQQAGGALGGISFEAFIPGSSNGNDYHINASPDFIFKDTTIVCFNAKFSYEYQARDMDGDSLTFSFGNAVDGNFTLVPPPYRSMSYNPGFSGISPLGPGVRIDSLTGIISGTAPSTPGEYVIAVYVHEWRNGVMIASTRKELQITIGDCSITPAKLKTVYLNCDNYSFKFQNEAFASNITSYAWDFGVLNSTTDVSTNPSPNFTYPNAGTYTLKLNVSNSKGCHDSATAEVKVYPGFTPSFIIDGTCFQNPIKFIDNSILAHGSVSEWAWNFGDNSTTNDTASIAAPSYKYPAPVNTSAMMSITATTGCAGSISKPVPILDKPMITLGFSDTLICSIDTLPLKVQISGGTVRWTPNYQISDPNISNPLVNPKDTTEYKIVVTDNGGCIDSATVKVNVLDYITVKIFADTGICRTDSIVLRPESDALSYRWRESGSGATLSSHSVKYPVAKPLGDITYHVTANLGYCQDSAVAVVHVSPYPVARLGRDTVVCFGHRIPLPAYIEGSRFTWSPTQALTNTNTLQPFAAPSKNTSYVLTVGDNKHCPKEVSDTIHIQVIPAFSVYAGRDTVTGMNQPLQLSATGADPSYNYTWTPALYLDNSTIANPIATITDPAYDVLVYTVKATSPEGCSATDDVKVQIFNKGPEIYIPSAFTPNGDGRNDVLLPVPIGITQFTFTIYNRWGQVIFTTQAAGKGWDGTFKGIKQPPGTYVYTVQGQDYSGKAIQRKGTIVLIN